MIGIRSLALRLIIRPFLTELQDLSLVNPSKEARLTPAQQDMLFLTNALPQPLQFMSQKRIHDDQLRDKLAHFLIFPFSTPSKLW